MKNNKKGLAKKKTDRNTLLNEVGGAVEDKLRWEFYPQSDMWRTKTFDIYDPCKRGTHVTLWHNGRSIGFFAKIEIARKVAKLIYNG